MEIIIYVLIAHVAISLVAYGLHLYSLSLTPVENHPEEVLKTGKYICFVPVLNILGLIATVQDTLYIKWGIGERDDEE